MSQTLLEIAQKHYENFPVGSFLLKKKYREPIHLIYVFARVADDLADEGNKSSEERIAQLNEWDNLFHQSLSEEGNDEFMRKLAGVVHQYDLPVSLFDDLLTAFKRDAINPIYQSFGDVLDYCTYSANPIGRLLLKLFDCSNTETERLSDDICTALQLTNFWQDISVDTRRNRFYIPREEFERYNFTIADLSLDSRKINFVPFMKNKIDWTRKLFESGRPLFDLINSDFRFELKLTWHGGMRILEKIEAMEYDTRVQRPTLKWDDKILIFSRAWDL